MKSIKLKAEEHLRKNNITQYEYKSYIEGADFGANYVLDKVECILLDKELYCEDMCNELMELIKELRKEK